MNTIRLAEDVIVRLVDRYLADHRHVFQRDEQARQHLIGVLDTFVRAGSEGRAEAELRIGRDFSVAHSRDMADRPASPSPSACTAKRSLFLTPARSGRIGPFSHSNARGSWRS